MRRFRGATVLLSVCCAACSPSPPPPGVNVASFEYGASVAHGTCAPGAKDGHAGSSNGRRSSDGLYYNVRAPANYRPIVAHPLLVVYPSAGASADQSELMTQLTGPGTRAGFVVAYVSHRPMTVEAVHALAKIPSDVALHWCIDLAHVYATGHSDGGTASTAVAVLRETKGILSGIAPSAAGFTREDLEPYGCPAALPVMVMHGREDRVFPGWGRQAAAWWASCNRCSAALPARPLGDGCVEFQDCTAGGRTLYCEGGGDHRTWPGLGEQIVRFFAHE